MERFIDPDMLNLAKDVGISLVALLVLGKIIFTLVQAVQEFLKGTREENRARNRHFEALLEINQAIANQIELTRLAIERESESNARQDKAIQASLAELAALRADIASGFEATQGQFTQGLAPISDKLEGIEAQLNETERAILDAFERVAGTTSPAEKTLLDQN
jgi:hypothetical protein